MINRNGLLLLSALFLVACGKDDGISGELATLQGAGLALSPFTEANAEPLGAKACQSGSIDDLAALVCQYSSVEAVSSGNAGAESWIGTAITGAVLKHDRYLLVIADHGSTDLNGKKISSIARTFRRQAAPIESSVK